MTIKPDALVYSNLTEVYLNYDTLDGSIHLDADILPNGFSQSYDSFIPYTRGGTISDVYVEQNGMRISTMAGGSIAASVYQFKSTESARIRAGYTADTIVVSLDIFNGSGSSITLIPQDIAVRAVLYDAPITAI